MYESKQYKIQPGRPEFPGARRIGDGINFTFSVPEGEEAELVIYDRTDKELLTVPLPEEARTGDLRSVLISPLSPSEITYSLKVGGVTEPDPYAQDVSGKTCRLAALNYDWEDIASPEIALSDLIIYKLHVRGFTKKAGPAVRAKGTFAGVTEKIPYIKDLGFNAVELMPVYEWNDALKELPPYAKLKPSGVSADKVIHPRNYWGYSDKNLYFAPKSAFAASKDPTVEIRDMIKAFHKAGILVLMEMYFPAGTYPAYAQSAVRHWQDLYRIDGFRLIGAGVPVETLVKDPMLKKTLLLFDGIDTGWVYGGMLPKRKHLAEENNGFLETGRSFLKGDEGKTGDFAWHIRKNPAEIGVINYMASVNGFTLSDMVSYDWKHNEENGENNQDGAVINYSWNCGAEGRTRKKAVITLRSRQIRNALLYIFLSQGIPMLMAGDESGNTQNGNNNAYSADNTTGWTDWSASAKDRALTEFVRKLTAFRKNHRILHMPGPLRGLDYISCGYPDISFHDTKAWVCQYEHASRSLGVLFCGLYAKDETHPEDEFIFAGFNAYWEDHSFALPNLPAGYGWYETINTFREEGREFTEDFSGMPYTDRSFTAGARSVVVLTGRKLSEKTVQKMAASAQEANKAASKASSASDEQLTDRESEDKIEKSTSAEAGIRKDE